MWLQIAAIVLLAHGIGHVMEPMAAWTPKLSPFSRRASAFSGAVTANSPIGKADSLVWILPMVGFAATAVGIWTAAAWWPWFAVASSIASLVAVLPWWGPMPKGSYVGAVTVDLVVLLALLGPWRDQVLSAL